MFTLICFLARLINAQIDTVWQDVGLENELFSFFLEPSYVVYSKDSISGIWSYEKWKYGACPWCCTDDHYFNIESGTLSSRNPDIKNGIIYKVTSEVYKNEELFLDNKLIEISTQTIYNSQTGEQDTISSPIYMLQDIQLADSVLSKINHNIFKLVSDSWQTTTLEKNKLCNWPSKLWLDVLINQEGIIEEVTVLKSIAEKAEEILVKDLKYKFIDIIYYKDKPIQFQLTVPITIHWR